MTTIDPTSLGHPFSEGAQSIPEKRSSASLANLQHTSPWFAARTLTVNFFVDASAAHVRVPASEAIGRIAAETVVPDPPGIPALAPGEVVQGPVVEALQAEAAAGTSIRYCGDPNLETILVVAE